MELLEIDILYVLFAGAVILAIGLATVAIRAPRPARSRLAAVALAALLLPLGYAQMNELLSRPKPMSRQWFDDDAKKATILGLSMDQGRAIYLWMRVEGSTEPRYFVVPWKQQIAEILEDAMENATARRGAVVINEPFGYRFDEWGEHNVKVELPPLPPMKLPPAPQNPIDPRERDT